MSGLGGTRVYDRAVSRSFVLETVAAATSVPAARLFVADVARHFSCADEVVEDLKLAVSEACAAVMTRGAPVLHIEVKTDGVSLIAEVGASGDATSPDGAADLGLCRTIILALFPEADFPAGAALVRIPVPRG